MKLMVSFDAGTSYLLFMRSDSVETLIKCTEKKDNQAEDISWTRWYIEDEEGGIDMTHLCPIHQRILASMSIAEARIRKDE